MARRGQGSVYPRRTAFAGLSLALGACAAPGARVEAPAGAPLGTPTGGAERHGTMVSGFIPTPQEPRPDGRLTLIWFSEPE